MYSGYFDCHMHEMHNECGGFLIALDGRRGSTGGYNNREVLQAAVKKEGVIPVQYITWNFDKTETSIVKYHPRRELYAPDEVVKDIRKRCPKAVIIDTLNQPDWQPKDYWNITKQFTDIQFLLSHAGGFDMLQFLNIAMYQSNVWIDFSFVQDVFGFIGDNIPLKQIVELIDYGLREKKVYKKLLFGTDNMQGEDDCTEKALKIYSKYDSYNIVVRENYMRFKEKAGIF